VAADDYLLRCYRYIELNPVTARMVDKPEQYHWSSYRANACEGFDPLLTAHPLYLALANDAKEHCFNYRVLFRVPLCDDNVHEIREAVTMNRELGNARFKAEVESVTG
jgi:putative transposase